MADSPIVHWFPGHMAKATRMITEYIKKVDVVIELLDARIPRSSANPVILELVGQKPHIVLLNKVDLADPKATKEWTEFFTKQGITVLAIDSKSGKGNKKLLSTVERLSKPIIDRWVAKGIRSRSVRTIILGIPNVGKSTLINSLAGSAATRTANKAGHTRGQQWVKIGKNLELLDTPGVLWPKFESNEVALNLAFTGTIKDDILDKTEIAFKLVKILIKNYKSNIIERYKLENDVIEKIIDNENIEESDKILEIIDLIAKKRGAILSGSRIDYEKISGIILDEFRSGKLGKITLELPKK